MCDVTERVRTGLYVLDSDNMNSLTSPPTHYAVFACNGCFLFLSSEREEKLIELVRKCEEYDMANKKYSDSESYVYWTVQHCDC